MGLLFIVVASSALKHQSTILSITRLQAVKVPFSGYTLGLWHAVGAFTIPIIQPLPRLHGQVLSEKCLSGVSYAVCIYHWNREQYSDIAL